MPRPLPRALQNPTLRLALASAALLLITAVLAATLFVRSSLRDEVATQQRLAQYLTGQHAPALGAALAASNIAELDRQLDAIIAEPAVAVAQLTDSAGATILTRGGAVEPLPWTLQALAHTPDVRELVAGLRSGDQAVGFLKLTLSNTPLIAGLRQTTLAAGSIALGLWLALLFLARLQHRHIVAPLASLTSWLRETTRGRWTTRPALPSIPCREIQELSDAFTEGAAVMRHQFGRLEETRELLEHSERRLRWLVTGTRDILFELDTNGRLRFLNPAWEKLTGFPRHESVGKPFADFLLDEGPARQFRPDALARLQVDSHELMLRTVSGRPLWACLRAAAQHDAAGNFTGVRGTLADITRRVELDRLLGRYQDELYQLSVTDPLTGLYNRRHFDGQLEKILADHHKKDQPVCLLLINLDGFKFINDTYGHPFGDEVLRATARLLRELVRRNDYLARLAGDEFAMVLKNADLANATHIAHKLHTRIGETRVALAVGSMQLQSSIGVAEAPTHGLNAQELVGAADVALYHSKRRGRNRIEALSPDISKAMMSIFNQGFLLRQALDEGHMHPALQPIYDMHRDCPIAYEVLARMCLNGAVIQAKDFITVAEELGLTRDVDLHVIGAALACTDKHQALFLNVDLSSFSYGRFVDELSDLLRPACLAGRQITIEITERETSPINDALRRDIGRLREFGCKLALDDFGSGYSTYNFLNQFRPDYLKIEGSFVRGMLESESDRKIVAHIHELATSFGMQTIAEGVENEATDRALREIGIRNAQGIYYGEPCLVG